MTPFPSSTDTKIHPKGPRVSVQSSLTPFTTTCLLQRRLGWCEEGDWKTSHASPHVKRLSGRQQRKALTHVNKPVVTAQESLSRSLPCTLHCTGFIRRELRWLLATACGSVCLYSVPRVSPYLNQ